MSGQPSSKAHLLRHVAQIHSVTYPCSLLRVLLLLLLLLPENFLWTNSSCSKISVLIFSLRCFCPGRIEELFLPGGQEGESLVRNGAAAVPTSPPSCFPLWATVAVVSGRHLPAPAGREVSAPLCMSAPAPSV